MLIKRIKKNKPKSIDIRCDRTDCSPYDMCVIEHDYDATTSETVNKTKKYLLLCDTYKIRLFNENYEKVRTIECINSKIIAPNCITSNNLDRLYISDLNDDTIIICDYDFKQINEFGVNGSEINQFDHISDLTYSNGYLYVCDTYNQRIQCYLTQPSDLQFAYALQLDIEPEQIEVYNVNLACIYGNLALRFYDLNNFSLIIKHQLNDSTICLINNYIYQLDYIDNKFQVFDFKTNSKLDELNQSLNVQDVIPYTDRRSMVYFNGSLVVSLSESKLIVF